MQSKMIVRDVKNIFGELCMGCDGGPKVLLFRPSAKDGDIINIAMKFA